MALTANMFAYSAMKKSANRIPLYSVWKPATISDSASGKSKGVRFTSAIDEIKKTKKAINVKGVRKNQPAKQSVGLTSDDVLHSQTLNQHHNNQNGKPPAGFRSSRFAAADRSAPKSDHLLLDDQPAIMTPITTTEEIAII